MKIYGVTGRKDSGKTGLMVRLIAHFAAQGLKVASVKHAHHGFDVDSPGRDSYRHREAGAAQVAIASPMRWAVMGELRGAEEPDLTQMLARLDPADLVLVEGYKTAPHPKIETIRQGAAEAPLFHDMPSICALACDHAINADLPQFDLDDTAAIADFIKAELGL